MTPAIEWRRRQEMQRDARSFEPAEADFLAVRQPSRRFVKDANVAGLIAFPCSPNAEDINGSVLPVDGAWTAGLASRRFTQNTRRAGRTLNQLLTYRP